MDNELSRMVLGGALDPGDRVVVGAEEGSLTFEVLDGARRRGPSSPHTAPGDRRERTGAGARDPGTMERGPPLYEIRQFASEQSVSRPRRALR